MKRNTVPIIVITCVVILVCCLLGILLISAGIVFVFKETSVITITEFPELPLDGLVVPEPTPILIRPDESTVPFYLGALEILDNTSIPVSDLPDLARRLEGKENIPIKLPLVTKPLATGTVDQFWVTNTDTNENFLIEATLQFITDHSYYWIENGTRYNRKDLEKLAKTFENKIYPLNREYFGSEWQPGIDGDDHLYIIYSSGLGRNLAGYYSSADEYHSMAHEYSNMHETFMLNSDNLDFDEEYTYSVLAHEFQHMIHWNQDRNEEAWLNEGLSELAAFINGYDLGGFDYLYTSDPDLQLTDWPNEPSLTSPHYGASFLFTAYFLDRFGPSAIKSLAKHPKNGMTSVDEVLATIDARDMISGESINADDVFLDWVLATYLKDPDILDGRFGYQSYSSSPRINDTEVVNFCPSVWLNRNVHQYGVDYIRIPCKGDYTVLFEGSIEVNVLPVNPHSGDFSFWSNKGDDSDMTLTQTFDFRDVEGSLTLSYWTWYDIEEDYDYVYLEASQDGESWLILQTPSGTEEDPSGNSFGWGYNGSSKGPVSWVREEVDLSQFAGEEVQIRFEYVTDPAVNGEGFLIDDISIPEIGYSSGFETGDGGWEAAGFVRIQNSLPQRFRLALIENGKETRVRYIELSDENSIEIPFHIGEDVNEIILVVTGTTPFTRQKASYQYRIQSQ